MKAARSYLALLASLSLVFSCAPEPGSSGQEAPVATDTAGGVGPADEPYVSPYTNTPLGGSHVRQRQGRPVGAITTSGDIAVLELDEGVMSAANLFDLDGRTLRFTPDGGGFRVHNLPLEWVDERGDELEGNELRLTAFSFPFSGASWDAMTVDTMGLITFGGGYDDFGLGRYVHYELMGAEIVDTVPLIAPFIKHRMRGGRFVHETDDRVVITWDLIEPFAGDMTFEPTPHVFQAVLYASGQIDLSYRQMTARDAVVGVYTVPDGGAPVTEAADLSAADGSAPAAAVIFEGFHHYGLPGAENLVCSVIEAFGDRFDYMVWYADFRVDDQEAGTRSDGNIPPNVEGLGPRMDVGRRPSGYCSDGRLQVTWHQPVYANAVQAHERSPDGRWGNYDLALAQIAHELGHRWSTRSQAIVDGETIELRGRACLRSRMLPRTSARRSLPWY